MGISSVEEEALIIIPAYNEGAYLGSVLNKCKRYFPFILVIDDSSEDDTYIQAKNNGATYVLRHPFNTGQGIALLSGINYFLRYTDLKYLITFDADGQHDPKDALAMLNYAYKNSYDVVFGNRFNKKNKMKIPLQRIILLKAAIFIERIFYKLRLSDAHNGLRVLTREACLNLKNIHSSGMSHSTEIAVKLKSAGLKINEHACSINYDLDKKSTSVLSSLNVLSDLLQRK